MTYGVIEPKLCSKKGCTELAVGYTADTLHMCRKHWDEYWTDSYAKID